MQHLRAFLMAMPALNRAAAAAIYVVAAAIETSLCQKGALQKVILFDLQGTALIKPAHN
jgi:hypothetical protein